MGPEPVFITKEEFISQFKRGLERIRQDPSALETWEAYAKAVNTLRSQAVKQLKIDGMPGKLRSVYNDYLQRIAKYGYKEYLFYKDSTCGICLKPINKLEEVTIDHIYPLSLGGENNIANKQIAHSKCNVKKGDKIDVTKL